MLSLNKYMQESNPVMLKEMSYSEKLDEAAKKYRAAKEASKKNLAYPEIGTWKDFWEEHAKFYAAACDVLKEKLKKKERAVEIYDSMWRDACDYAEIGDAGECWPDEFKELEQLGEIESEDEDG